MKKIKQTEKYMRHIRREKAKSYKSNASEILHTDEKIPDLITRINKVT